MSITFVSSATATNASATTVTVGDPASTQENDLYIAWCSIEDDTTTTTATWDTPSGWTKVTQENSGTAFFAGDGIVALFYRKRGASAVGNTDFSLTSGTAAEIRTTIAAYRGVDGTTPFDVAYSSGSHRQITTNTVAPTSRSITTVTNNALVLCLQWFNFDPFSSRTPGAHSGYTLDVSNTGNGTTQFFSTKTVATAGTESPGAWGHTGDATTADAIDLTLALRPASAASYVLDLEPLYYVGQLLANKTGIEYVLESGHVLGGGATEASGSDGTTNASGVFQVPGGFSSSAADDVTLSLYWEEGNPAVDRSLIVKTTLVAA